jgi:hypothetical protein
VALLKSPAVTQLMNLETEQKMETTLIIGSNSFSGATFTDFALAQGGKVIGTSRSAEPNHAFLPYKWRDYKNFTFHYIYIISI